MMIHFRSAAAPNRPFPALIPNPHRQLLCYGLLNRQVKQATTTRVKALSIDSPCLAFNQTAGGRVLEDDNTADKRLVKKRVFFLDVNPLCYQGSKPCLRTFARWIALFFSDVCHDDPVIAVIQLRSLCIYH